MSPHCMKRLSSGWAVLLALVFVATVITPAMSHAISLAGDYIFTSVFTGTFTSDGSALTVWSFSVPSTVVHWTDSQFFIINANDSTTFSAATQAGDVRIDWTSNSFTARLNLTAGGIGNFAGPFSFQQATNGTVPEPSGFGLMGLGLGLLALVDYVWRQRRGAWL